MRRESIHVSGHSRRVHILRTQGIGEDGDARAGRRGGVGMLTKRQLEDAAKCPQNGLCTKCEMDCVRTLYNGYFDGCISEAAQTALAYREMLERACVILNDHFCGDEHYAGIGELEEVRKVLNEWKEITS